MDLSALGSESCAGGFSRVDDSALTVRLSSPAGLLDSHNYALFPGKWRAKEDGSL